MPLNDTERNLLASLGSEFIKQQVNIANVMPHLEVHRQNGDAIFSTSDRQRIIALVTNNERISAFLDVAIKLPSLEPLIGVLKTEGHSDLAAQLRGSSSSASGTVGIASSITSTSDDSSTGRESSSKLNATPLRILCIDGGGIRGVIPLRILQEIMPNGKQPCEIFDLICGTSAGGILAILLGIYKIPIDDCLDLFIKIASDAFPKKSGANKLSRLFKKGERYSSKNFEDVMKYEIENTLKKDPNLMMSSDAALHKENETPRVFLVSTPAVNMCELFRNYGTQDQWGTNKISVLDAVRATSAAPTYFKSQKNGIFNYIDGGMGFNNPAKKAIEETDRIPEWKDRTQRIVVSLGTGVQRLKSYNDNSGLKEIIAALQTIATDTEHTHWDLHGQLIKEPQYKYFRFNPGQGAGDIHLDQPELMASALNIAKHYMQDPDVAPKLNKVKEALSELPNLPSSSSASRTAQNITSKQLVKLWNVPPQNPNFTGRDQILEQLASYFSIQSDSSKLHKIPTKGTVISSIHGLGGVGKTQLAIHFVYKYQEFYPRILWFPAEALEYDICLMSSEKQPRKAELDENYKNKIPLLVQHQEDVWIYGFDIEGNTQLKKSRKPVLYRRLHFSKEPTYATNISDDIYFDIGSMKAHTQASNRVETAYRQLAQHLKMDSNQSQQALILEIKSWMERNPSCLLVFDNAPCLVAIQEYIPLNGCHVLVTSRRTTQSSESVQPIEITVFRENEAIAYLQKLLKNHSHEEKELKKLVETLGYLPLALNQAGAFIKENKVTIQAYLTNYETNKKELLEDVSMSNFHNEPVLVTWDITMKAIQNKSSLATKMLNVCAYIYSEDIPEFLLQPLTDSPEHNPEKEIYIKARGILSNYSMITVNPEKAMVSLHRLLQEVIQLKEQKEHKPLKLVYELLEKTFPDGDSMEELKKKGTLVPHMETAFHHLLNNMEDPSKSLSVCHKLSYGYRALGDHQKLCSMTKFILTVTELVHGPDHIEVATALNNLGNAYGSLGDYIKQRDVLERSLNIQKQHYGPDHPDVVKTLINLGNAYGNLGDHSKERILLELTLNIAEQYYGPDHIEVARTLNNLGSAYGNLGDHSKEREVLERALNIAEQYYGRDHIEVGATLNNLGNAYGSLEDHNKKHELVERALKIREQHYGPDHPEVARTLNNLGNTYRSLGDHSKERELQERVLRIRERHYGLDHPEVVAALNNLANAYGSLGDHSKKRELLERALRILKQHYPDHPYVTLVLRNLDNCEK